MRYWAAVLMFLVCVCCLGCGVSKPTATEVKLSNLFTDDMVLQRKLPITVFGKAKSPTGGRGVVVVGLDKDTAVAKVDSEGRWRAMLPSHAAGGPYTLTVAGANRTLEVRNVMVGEVWVCSGQSNMEFTVNGCKNAKEEIEKANHPTIRLFNIAPTKHLAVKPEDDVNAKWEVCSPATVGNFSAVAYFFGRELSEKLNVTVGLINSPWGGSPVEQWIPMETYKNDPALADFPARMEKEAVDYLKAMDDYSKRMEKWKAAKDKILATNPGAATQPGAIPNQPWQPQQPQYRYSAMYNGNIAPIVGYGIRGAIWYQGESNAGNPMGYRKSFPAMIRGWRKAWGQGDFPFLFVQLANFMDRPMDPNVNGTWAELREAQTLTLSTPKTGMAVITDVGDAADIHPRDKQTVGHRLAIIAEANTYGMKDVVFSGPLFHSMTIDGNKIRLSFKHVDGGLVVKGDKLAGFAVAGKDGKYVWAGAAIEGDTVVVSSDKVEKPVMVRYAWGNNPECSLYNKADLPASPFRAGKPESKAAK
jgi:sialate O-acetylesterase